jgi:hypothetical protein
MPHISSNYLKSSIEELNNEIIYDPTESEFFNPILPRTHLTIAKCWKFYNIESSDGEDIEIIPIDNYKNYNPNTGIKKFDFDALDNSIDLIKLKKDLQANVILMQSHFYEKVEEILLHQSTDLQISHSLKEIIKNIVTSISSLKSLQPNKTQTVLKDLLLSSYKKTIDKIYLNYSGYLPERESIKTPDEDIKLKEFIYPDQLKEFKLMESNLFSHSWLVKENGMYIWNRKNVELVDLSRFLKEKEIVRGNRSIPKFIRFLEDRYNLKVGTQSKPSKYNKRPLKNFLFEFLLE